MKFRRWALFTALTVVGVGFGVAPALGSRFQGDVVLVDVMLATVSMLVYFATGGLIISRRDGHLTGWLLSLVGLALVFANGFALWPGVSESMAAWVESWSWTVVFALYATLALTFPSGRLPRGRLGRAALVVLALLVAMAPFSRTLGGTSVLDEIENPVGFLPGPWISPLGTVAILLAAGVSLVVRQRRAGRVERAQLAWVTFAMAILITAVVLTFAFILTSIAIGAGDPGDDAWIVVFLAMLLFPVAFGVALVRYRLFEIDRVVSRSVTYGLVLVMLVGLYAGGVLLLRSLIPTQGELAVAASTLAVSALFNPLRRRVQQRVDRRFNRARYDGERELQHFAGVMRDELDLDATAENLIAVVSRTMQPAAASLWIREGQ